MAAICPHMATQVHLGSLWVHLEPLGTSWAFLACCNVDDVGVCWLCKPDGDGCGFVHALECVHIELNRELDC